MNKILFPAGMRIDLIDVNMEIMEFYARDWNLERIQIQKGFYTGSIRVAYTPRLQLMRTPHSHGLLIRGEFPKGTILIAFISTKSHIAFHDQVADSNEVKILKSGEEIDFLCNGKSETFTIVAEEQFFYDAFYSYFGLDFNQYKKDRKIYIDQQSFIVFLQGFERWTDYLMQDHDAYHTQENYEKIELAILQHVFNYIQMDGLKKHRHKFDVSKARKLMHQSFEHPVDIKLLAKELKISERLLYHAFKKNYGTTPGQYMFGLRMHHVRQALLRSDPFKTNISSVIEKYYFFNQSTFSQAYKQMFGELPSETFKTSN